MISTLIYTATMSLNAAPVTHQPDLAWRFAGAETPPPDHLRTPCSDLEVARRIGIPRATALRQLEPLTERGACLRVGRKFLLSIDYMQPPDVLYSGLAVVVKVAQILRALEAMGLDDEAIRSLIDEA